MNGATNFWLVLRSDGSYVFADTLDPSAYREGQTTLDLATITFHSTDLTTATYPWSIERTVVGDVLHIGIASYARR